MKETKFSKTTNATHAISLECSQRPQTIRARAALKGSALASSRRRPRMSLTAAAAPLGELCSSVESIRARLLLRSRRRLISGKRFDDSFVDAVSRFLCCRSYSISLDCYCVCVLVLGTRKCALQVCFPTLLAQVSFCRCFQLCTVRPSVMFSVHFLP